MATRIGLLESWGSIDYDRNGCVQNVAIAEHGRIACDYDQHNQLTLLNTTTQGWRYTYDPFGRRVKEHHTTGPHVYERDYLYDSDVEIGSLERGRTEMRFTMARGWGQRPRTVGMEVKGELFSAATNTSR